MFPDLIHLLPCFCQTRLVEIGEHLPVIHGHKTIFDQLFSWFLTWNTCLLWSKTISHTLHVVNTDRAWSCGPKHAAEPLETSIVWPVLHLADVAFFIQPRIRWWETPGSQWHVWKIQSVHLNLERIHSLIICLHECMVSGNIHFTICVHSYVGSVFDFAIRMFIPNISFWSADPQRAVLV